MRNRPETLTFIIALSLIIVSTVVVVSRPGGHSQTTERHWKITRLDNGQVVDHVIQSDLPNDPSELFPNRAQTANVSYHIEPTTQSVDGNLSTWFSSRRLSRDERRLIEFLLLLPPASLLVCFFRNVIGLSSYGTFAPALLGLAFREVHSPLGVFLVLTIITAGWWLRRGLNELHMLQAPRSALLLSCVVVMLLVLLSITGKAGPSALTLFPLVILTGMIERFWTMEEEEGTGNSIGTLASTLFMAGCVWLLAVIPGVSAWMLAHPETLGFVMAGQLLLGRYTGFRLLELYRFRALMNEGELMASRAA
jgi:hypothetical protein